MRTRWWSRVVLALVVGAGVTCQQAPGPIGGPPSVGLDAELVMPTRWAVGSHVGARIKVLEARDLRSLDPAGGRRFRTVVPPRPAEVSALGARTTSHG